MLELFGPFLIFAGLFLLFILVLAPLSIGILICFLVYRFFLKNRFSKKVSLVILGILFIIIYSIVVYLFIAPEKKILVNTVSDCEIAWKQYKTSYNSPKNKSVNNCIERLAIRDNNHSICDSSIPDESFDKQIAIDNCYRAFATEKKDENICGRIIDNPRREYCYSDLAKIRKDIDICKNILSEDIRKSCTERMK